MGKPEVMVECRVICIVIRGVHHFSWRFVNWDWLIEEWLHLFLLFACTLWKIVCAGCMDFHAQNTFDALPELTFQWGHEGDSDSANPSTPGASDTVDIVFFYWRQLEVDDIWQIWDVQTTRRDIGCDQQAHTAIPEFLEGSFALILCPLAVDSGA